MRSAPIQSTRPLRLLLGTLGSRGDVEPFLHLAHAAQAAGHSVRVAIPDQNDLATDGLDIVSLGVRFTDFAQGRSSSAMHEFRKRIRPAMSRALAAFVEAGTDWDPGVIVAHPKILTAPVLAEHHDVPHMVAELTPTLTPTAEFPAAGIASKSLGAVINRVSYGAVGMAGSMFASDVRAARRRLGVQQRLPAPTASLVAISPTLLPRPADWPTTAHITGDWHHTTGGSPVDADLQAFIEADAPFIYAGFGSMTDGDPRIRAEAIIDGARSTGLRVLMATGWGGLQPPTRCLGTDVLVTESVSHQEVLPHAVAAIHHGGAGTTHAVARAGIPSIVVPFLADQPFWAVQLERLGLASPPLHRNRLTRDRVRAAIAASMKCAPRARQVAQHMSKEDGAKQAVSLIAKLTTAIGTEN